MMHTVFMAFVDTAALCLKLGDVWGAYTFIVHVRKLILPSLRKKFTEASERESWTK